VRSELAPGGTLVDANILLDIFTCDPAWVEWSRDALAEAFDIGAVIVNPIVYAEISIRFEHIEELDEALPAQLQREALPWEAAFLAGKCFREYRRRGGTRRSPLPDFYIGAHAAVSGRALLTRDRTRYRSFFPTLALVSP
jgi:predicted nucleic acid-binding protein